MVVFDPYWRQVLVFLKQHAQPLDPILTPIEFLQSFPGAYYYHVDHTLPPEHFRYVVIHKGMLDHISPKFLREVLTRFYPVIANEVFVVYQPHRPLESVPVENLPVPEPPPAELPQQVSSSRQTGIVVTTFNRPWALARSLPQIVRLGAPVLVVDDGSAEPARGQNEQIAHQNDTQLLCLPCNRGHCCATGIGVEYWLADPACQWISAFEDDLDVRPDCLDVLAVIQDAQTRPFLTGFYAPEHPVVGQEIIACRRVLLQRSTRGCHNHAHRDYWRAVLPIPTPYLGAPKKKGLRPGQGSEMDWWITAWAPASVTKRGGYVVCIPDLVQHFAVSYNQSTWGNAINGEAGKEAYTPAEP